MLLSPNSSWFKQVVLLLISSRFYGGTKGQTYQVTSPTQSFQSRTLCVVKRTIQGKNRINQQKTHVWLFCQVVSVFLATWLSFPDCSVLCSVLLLFSNVLCNPLQPPLSQHRVFLLLLPFVCFSLGFCLVWFILCCFLDQLYERGPVWTFGLSVLSFQWKC